MESPVCSGPWGHRSQRRRGPSVLDPFAAPSSCPRATAFRVRLPHGDADPRPLPPQGRLAVAGGAPAEVVPRRWQAALRGHAPQQLLGADGGTLLQEVRVAPAHSAGPLPARPPGAFLLRSVGAAWGVRARPRLRHGHRRGEGGNRAREAPRRPAVAAESRRGRRGDGRLRERCQCSLRDPRGRRPDPTELAEASGHPEKGSGRQVQSPCFCPWRFRDSRPYPLESQVVSRLVSPVPNIPSVQPEVLPVPRGGRAEAWGAVTAVQRLETLI